MSREDVATRFVKDTAEHVLTIVKDDGLYRHLRVQKPGTWCYGYDIVTWPGYLSITGDMGASVFARLPDMLVFFRGKPDGDLQINPGYWAEKLEANDKEPLEYRSELFRAYVKEHFDQFVSEHTEDREEGEEAKAPEWAAALWEDLENDVLSPDEDWDSLGNAIEAMTNFEPDKDSPYARFRFSDAWESARSLQDYRFHFLWRLYAIVHAIRLYDTAKAAPPAEATPA